MRNRYVMQVLLATFGFGLLLAVVAVLQTPGVFLLQGADGANRPAGLRQGSSGAAPAQTNGATHRTDSKAECEHPIKAIDDCPQPEAQEICQRTRGPHEKTKRLAN